MKYILAPTKDYIAHSAKGSTWKDHKYIRKEGDKYIYDTPHENIKLMFDDRRELSNYANMVYDEDVQAILDNWEYLTPEEKKKYYRQIMKYGEGKTKEQYGAGGMPSSAIKKQHKNDDYNIDLYRHKSEDSKWAHDWARDTKHDMDLLSGKTSGGMPSDVSRKALRVTEVVSTSDSKKKK